MRARLLCPKILVGMSENLRHFYVMRQLPQLEEDEDAFLPLAAGAFILPGLRSPSGVAP